FFFLPISVLLIRCDLPELKQPEYVTDYLELISQVAVVVGCENVEITSTTESVSNSEKPTCTLTLTLRNCPNLKEDATNWKALGKKGVKTLVNGIKNKDDFDRFEVKFTQSSGFAGFQREFTKNYAYRLDEL
ncbi:MAG: hypothetical protein AAFV78_08655, partial [Bacteroidota bacterium]